MKRVEIGQYGKPISLNKDDQIFWPEDSCMELTDEVEKSGRFFRPFSDTSKLMSWEEASNVCKEMNGQLASIRSEQDSEMVARLVND